MATPTDLADRLAPEGISGALRSFLWSLILMDCEHCRGAWDIVKTTKAAREKMKRWSQRPDTYAHPQKYDQEPTYYEPCGSLRFWQALEEWPADDADWPKGKLLSILGEVA